MRCKGWRAALGAVLAGVALGAVAVQAEPRRTNYELVSAAAQQAAVQLVESLKGKAPDKPLALRGVGTHAGNFLVENALSTALTQAGHPVRTKADSTGPVLEFEVVELGLAYTRVHRRAWLGSERVEREARARLFSRLVDQAHASVVWADRAEAKVHDEVRQSDLAELEEKSPPDYLKATMPSGRWNKLVEPAVVTGIVVGLIVLFFSNQNTQ